SGILYHISCKRIYQLSKYGQGWLLMHFKHYKEFSFLLCLIFLLSVVSSCSNASNNTASKNVHASRTATSPPHPTPCTEGSPGGPTTSQISVTVKPDCVLGVSNYAAGLTYNDNSLLSYANGGTGNAYAVSKVDALIPGTFTYENT